MRWFYAGPIECPDCRCPITSETMFCPYCSSSAPMRAPWMQMQWISLATGAAVLAALWLCDHCLGTHVLTWLLSGLTQKGAQAGS